MILYPKTASKETLRKHLVSLGFQKCDHLWPWPKGSIHFSWFESEDFQSVDGVEATIFPLEREETEKHGGCEWGMHTRTRASASPSDRQKQNEVIRTARKAFGGQFTNDGAYGNNHYIAIEDDGKSPAGRGIFLSYEYVMQHSSLVKLALPMPITSAGPVDAVSNNDMNVKEYIEMHDPARVIYNALIPFAVAALEHFFSRTFKILLRYDKTAKRRLSEQNRKVEMQDALAIASGEMSIEYSGPQMVDHSGHLHLLRLFPFQPPVNPGPMDLARGPVIE